MTNFDRILRFAAIILLAAAFHAPALRATSFSYTPDTITFSPTSPDSVISYVRIAYQIDSFCNGIVRNRNHPIDFRGLWLISYSEIDIRFSMYGIFRNAEIG